MDLLSTPLNQGFTGLEPSVVVNYRQRDLSHQSPALTPKNQRPRNMFPPAKGIRMVQAVAVGQGKVKLHLRFSFSCIPLCFS